ncbi:hypothetical protein TNCV_4018201 [Trichonephila clavipes]|nr:hypothetical protein TNCV_4018201 [Trichonephila clavipes]
MEKTLRDTSTHGTPTDASSKSSLDQPFSPITETREKSGQEPEEIGNLIKEVADFARQINLAMDSDDVQILLDFHSHEQTIDELVEMHEQEQNNEQTQIFRHNSIR